MLHLGPGAGELDRRARGRARPELVSSTSPSSLLLGSLDAARRHAMTSGARAARGGDPRGGRGPRADPRAARASRCWTTTCCATPASTTTTRCAWPSTSAAPAPSGYELAELLLEQSDIGLELYGEHLIVAVFGIAEPVAESCDRLVAALEARRPPIWPTESEERTRRPPSSAPRWGAAGHDPARGLPRPAGGHPDGGRRRPGCRRVAGRLPARHPQRLPRRAAHGRDAQPHQAHASSRAARCAASATRRCAPSAWPPRSESSARMIQVLQSSRSGRIYLRRSGLLVAARRLLRRSPRPPAPPDLRRPRPVVGGRDPVRRPHPQAGDADALVPVRRGQLLLRRRRRHPRLLRGASWASRRRSRRWPTRPTCWPTPSWPPACCCWCAAATRPRTGAT